MSLVDQIKNDDAQARSDNLTRYSEILHRADDPRDGDAAQLRELLKTLDITVKAFEADAAAVKQTQQAQHNIEDAQARQRDPARAQQERDARAEVARLEVELREAQLTRNRAMLELDQAQKSEHDNRARLHDIRERHPRAFAQEPPAPAGPQIGQMRRQRELGHG